MAAAYPPRAREVIDVTSGSWMPAPSGAAAHFQPRSREYEVRVLSIPATSSRNEVRRLLTEEAEVGRWELIRTRVYSGGHRKVWLRRPVIRVVSTL